MATQRPQDRDVWLTVQEGSRKGRQKSHPRESVEGDTPISSVECHRGCQVNDTRPTNRFKKFLRFLGKED